MQVGILNITSGECVSDERNTYVNEISAVLSMRGHFVNLAVSVCDDSKIADSFEYLKSNADSVLVCGSKEKFYNCISQKYKLDSDKNVFMLGDTPCAVMEKFDSEYLVKTVLPLLNYRTKTFYATTVFRTVGKTEENLRELLKDYVKNRNKIVIKFVSDPPECDVLVRYSSNTQKNTLNEFLTGVQSALADCIYSFDEQPLSYKVATALMQSNKTLGIAESFTGGNIAAELVKYPGISNSLKEGIVCYSNEAKNKRLQVPLSVINNCGAVSDETAYKMALSLLVDGKYDYAVATTGNAGPTSEKADEVGVCYIAVGDRNSIDIYPYRFSGTREEVIHSGTVNALYRLYRKLQSVENKDDSEQ